MRFSCATALALVAALASSISALPTNTDIGYCPVFCHKSSECSTCFDLNKCVSFSDLCLGFNLDSPAWKTVFVCTGWRGYYAVLPLWHGHSPTAKFKRSSLCQKREKVGSRLECSRRILIVGGLEYAILGVVHASRSVSLAFVYDPLDLQNDQNTECTSVSGVWLPRWSTRRFGKPNVITKSS